MCTGSVTESSASTGQLAKSGLLATWTVTPGAAPRPLGRAAEVSGATSWIVVGTPLAVVGVAAHGWTKQIVVGGATGPAAVVGVGGLVVVVPSLPARRIDWPDAHAASDTHAPTPRNRNPYFLIP
jgi:hypothetical protein